MQPATLRSAVLALMLLVGCGGSDLGFETTPTPTPTPTPTICVGTCAPTLTATATP